MCRSLAPLASLLLFLGAASAARADLIHHYTFTSGAQDRVGGVDGVLLGGATVSSGALHLDGQTAHVQFPSQLVPASGSYTVAIFARQETRQFEHIELISQGHSGGPGFYIGHNPSGDIRVSDSWLNTGIPFPQDAAMHHYAIVADAAAGRTTLYIDGVSQAELPLAITTTTGGHPTRLGRQFEPYAEFFNGDIDDVRIYDHNLSAGEIASLAGTGLCPCDWNADAVVNSADFFDFLIGFFSGNADYNSDGHTDSQDFFDFLSCFLSQPGAC